MCSICTRFRRKGHNYTQRVATVGSPELLIVMGAQASAEQVDEVVARLEEAGASAHVSHGRDATVIGAIGERELLATLPLEGFPGVEQVLPILKPYKLVSRELRRDPTVIEARGRRLGGELLRLHRRSVHGRDARADARDGPRRARRGRDDAPRRRLQAAHVALRVPGARRRGARRSSPRRASETGLPLVTELMDPRDVEAVVEIADVIQIGARNMQNFTSSPRSAGRRSRCC